MSERKRLGILVTTPDRMSDLLEIARSAHSKKIALQVHLTGPGLLLCRLTAFARLRAQSRVYACRESARALELEVLLEALDPPVLLPGCCSVDLLLACDRQLVF